MSAPVKHTSFESGQACPDCGKPMNGRAFFEEWDYGVGSYKYFCAPCDTAAQATFYALPLWRQFWRSQKFGIVCMIVMATWFLLSAVLIR